MGRVVAAGIRGRARRWGARVCLIACVALLAQTALSSSTPASGPLEPEGAGAALKRAVLAMQQGQTEQAVELLRRVAERHALIADHADLLRMRLRVESGQVDEAVGMHDEWGHTESPLQSDFFALLGEAYAGRGDEVAARSSWEFARLETADPARLASLHLASARSYERSKEPSTAAESHLRVWSSYPLSPEAKLASRRLEELEKTLNHTFRTPLAQRKRGDALFRLRRNEAALEAYDLALISDALSAPERRRALRQRAETLFRLRRYREAVRAFDALPADDETRIARARAQARSGQVEEGARALEKLGRELRSLQGVRAQLLAGLLWDGEHEVDRARSLYQQVALRAPSSSYAGAALWRLGWTDYLAGRYEPAAAAFEELEARESDPIGGLRARYWRIRASEHAGREGTGTAFAALAREYPLSYYGWRARARADDDGRAPEPVVVRPGTAALSSEELARPRTLLEAGLDTEAREELDRLFHRARGLEDRLALAQLYSNAGDFHRPQRLMVDAYAEPLARGPAPAQLELWWHAWPAPFDAELRRARAVSDDVEPELVYAVMREESGYRPEVVSVSGARGLLQLMPSTAERLAREHSVPFSDADALFVPRVNIQLGSAYLAELLGRFSGRRSAAIGSYNAGPTAVARWLKEVPGEDDEWVEAIAYDQTRGYVKRVLRSVHAYRVLY